MVIKTPVDIGDSVYVIYDHYSNNVRVWEICQGTVMDMKLNIFTDEIIVVLKVRFKDKKDNEDERIFRLDDKAFLSLDAAERALDRFVE